MKKICIQISLLLFLACPAMAQYAYRIKPLPALPASCNPLNGDVVYLTAGAGISPGLYTCTATNTWRPAGFMGNQNVWAQGTITASTPIINHTVTWNNGAVAFTNFFSNTTDTASAGASYLMRLQTGGADKFFVTKAGAIFAGGQIEISNTQSYTWVSRSKIGSLADARVNMTDNAGTGGVALTLGPETAASGTRITPQHLAGGAQGILITKGDGTAQTFANLGAATNGMMIYCADCTIANPCAGGGTGAIAKRLNGAWVCN